jgi:hypothetical protein
MLQRPIVRAASAAIHWHRRVSVYRLSPPRRGARRSLRNPALLQARHSSETARQRLGSRRRILLPRAGSLSPHPPRTGRRSDGVAGCSIDDRAATEGSTEFYPEFGRLSGVRRYGSRERADGDRHGGFGFGHARDASPRSRTRLDFDSDGLSVDYTIGVDGLRSIKHSHGQYHDRDGYDNHYQESRSVRLLQPVILGAAEQLSSPGSQRSRRTAPGTWPAGPPNGPTTRP